MPPTGLHLFLGYVGARRLASVSIAVGFWWGMVLPDIDLIASVVAYILTRDPTLTLQMHRSLTHSAVLFIPLLMLGAIWMASIGRHSRPDPQRHPHPNPQRHPQRNRGRSIGAFIFALGLGMAVHAVFDLFYFSSVRFFYPFSNVQFALVPIASTDFAPVVQKVWAAADLLIDPIGYLVVVGAATRFGTDRRRARYLRRFALVAIAYFATLCVIGATSIALEPFIVLTYALGMAVIPISVMAPLLFRRTLRAANEEYHSTLDNESRS